MRAICRFLPLLVAGLLCSASATDAQTPANLQSVGDALATYFSPANFVLPLKSSLDYFQVAFTSVGWAAVMIVTVRRVMKARGGEESLGWVSGLVMTVAFMALAPKTGEKLFGACDELAAKSGYNGADSIKSSWKALLVILPNESPAHEILDAQKTEPKTPPPDKKMTQKVLLWNLFAEGWNNIRETFASVYAALTSVVNRVLVFIMLLIPSVVLLLGVLLTGIGTLVRELLRVSMDMFMPMMIAMLSFGPMRGAANSFILRYVGVALWPVAWALWNKVSLSLLVCTMNWVIATSQAALKGIPEMQNYLAQDPSLTAVKPGYFAAASLLLPWNLQVFLCLMIAFVSAMLAVGTVAAPAALTKTISHGAGFVQDQLRQAGQALAAVSSVAVPGAAPAIGASGAASGGASAISGMAMRASGSLSGVASQMGAVAAAGGPLAPLAAMGGGMLARAANMIGSLSSGSEAAGGLGAPSPNSGSPTPSIMRSMAGSSGESASPGANGGQPRISPRAFRRARNGSTLIT